ncbi:unnamed protein product [Heligmosomoides polygyrus]|uniref:Uncharacterized protein n=1 Tax=Heligmosomoides polygyrus TaxID=6339 RepID=A0A183GTN1_HELPZ|nr:unnamed protein product [Heligmosomoides polygyrus]
MSPTSFIRCQDSEDVSPVSRKAFQIQTTCHRCRARGCGFRRRVNDIMQSTSGLRTHVTDVVQQASGFRGGVIDVAPEVPDSHDVLTVKVGPLMEDRLRMGSNRDR